MVELAATTPPPALSPVVPHDTAHDDFPALFDAAALPRFASATTRSRPQAQTNGGEPIPALSWQQAPDIVRAAAPKQSLIISSPLNPVAVCRVRAATAGSPSTSFDVAIDAFSSEALKRIDWNQQTVWGSATTVGIPLHRGGFGGWNEALLALFGAGVLFSLITGWIMVWKRKRAGLAALPRLRDRAWRAAPWPLWVITPAMMWLMPLFLVTSPLVAVIEVVLSRRRNETLATE